MVLRAIPADKLRVTGKGLLIAMPDTGFYKHSFSAWHGYNYNASLSPDPTRLEPDESGHGTATAAHIFANVPDIDFVGVEVGGNPTLTFNTASDLQPAVVANSWGSQLPRLPRLPNFLKSLEAAVSEAVRMRGIIVRSSAGNGRTTFPAMMPDVIAVGGVYAHEE